MFMTSIFQAADGPKASLGQLHGMSRSTGFSITEYKINAQIHPN